MIYFNKNKIYNQIFAFISIAVLIEPNYFSQGPLKNVDKVYDVLKFIIFIAILVRYIYHAKVRREVVLIMVFILSIAFPTILYTDNAIFVIKTYAYVIAVVMLCDWLLKNDAPTLISSISAVFGLYTYISCLTLIAYPNGMYRHSVGYANCWFLGYKNIAVPILLVGMVYTLLNSYCRNEKISVYAWSIIICSEIYIFTVYSVTGILATCMVLGSFIVSRVFKKVDNVISCKNIVIFNGILFPLLTFIRIQNFIPILGKIFENLGKNLTFSSRTYLWDKFIPLIMNSILVGHGIQDGVFYVSKSGYRWAVHLHSYYFQILFEGGLIALVLLFLLLFTVAYTYDRESNNSKVHIVKYGFMGYLIANQLETYGQIATFFMLVMLLLNIESIEKQYSNLQIK